MIHAVMSNVINSVLLSVFLFINMVMLSSEDNRSQDYTNTIYLFRQEDENISFVSNII